MKISIVIIIFLQGVARLVVLTLFQKVVIVKKVLDQEKIDYIQELIDEIVESLLQKSRNNCM